MAEHQSTELIDQSVLLLRVIVGKILLQSLEKLALSILLALEARAYEGGDRFAHARIEGLGILFHLVSETGNQTDGISRFDSAPRIPLGLDSSASNALRCRCRMRHMPSGCLSLQQNSNRTLAFSWKSRGEVVRAESIAAKIEMLEMRL